MAGEKERAKRYQRKKLTLGMFSTAVSILFTVCFLAGGYSVHLRTIIYGWSDSHYIAAAAYTSIFLFLLEAVTFFIDIYRGYFIDKKYSISNETLTGWFKDTMKGLALSLLIGIILVEAIYILLRMRPADWWLIAGTLFVVLVIFLSNIAPVIIFPMFFKFKPLGDDELRKKLAEMAEGEGLKVAGAFEMDLSRKTMAANAALTGIGNTRRIILSDTLLGNFSHNEVETVLAHELGHHRYHHIWKLIALQGGLAFLGLFCADRVINELVSPLGMYGISDIAALPLLILTVSIVGLVFLPLSNAISRRMEISADRFALMKTGDVSSFVSCMERLSRMNLTDPEPHPVVEFIFHSHPSIRKRLELAGRSGG